jgi:putative ABC transport system ATP-binding protein/lipoprotein-releasing system ATP-binding protein
LTGVSGSGKSTLLHLLGGIDVPTTGTVSWPALGARASLRPGLIIDVFQSPSLLPPLSVLENVCLPLLLAGVPASEAARCGGAALDLFGLGGLRDKLPEEISGGQAQRVAMARALAVRPKLVLADEPTGQLDTSTAISVLDRFLAALAEICAAVVVATHDPRITERLDTVWTMRDGVLRSEREVAPGLLTFKPARAGTR